MNVAHGADGEDKNPDSFVSPSMGVVEHACIGVRGIVFITNNKVNFRGKGSIHVT